LTDAQQQSKELEKLRDDLSALELQLADAKEGSGRAERAESQLQQLTEEMAATVSLDIHEQVVRICRVLQTIIHS
jgi:Skp family chaperone for outer membrane proteins